MLLFVFRDRTKTPLEKLVETWEADLGRMWDAIAKPPQVRTDKSLVQSSTQGTLAFVLAFTRPLQASGGVNSCRGC